MLKIDVLKRELEIAKTFVTKDKSIDDIEKKIMESTVHKSEIEFTIKCKQYEVLKLQELLKQDKITLGDYCDIEYNEEEIKEKEDENKIITKKEIKNFEKSLKIYQKMLLIS